VGSGAGGCRGGGGRAGIVLGTGFDQDGNCGYACEEAFNEFGSGVFHGVFFMETGEGRSKLLL
jgi:phage FluMu gp28-like protein